MTSCRSTTDLDGFDRASPAGPLPMTRFSVWLLLAGCAGPLDPIEDVPGAAAEQPRCEDDDDWDGACADVDCDDEDPTAYPGAEEIWYSGVDEACDGGDDFDFDGDGFAAGEAEVHDTYYLLPDCDDEDPTIHPDIVPICGNAVDDDCDGRDECSLRGDVSTADLAGARLIGGYLRGAADFDGDGAAEWVLLHPPGGLVRVPAFSGDTEYLDRLALPAFVPDGRQLAFGPLGGSGGADVALLDNGYTIGVYLDPERDGLRAGTIDSGPGGDRHDQRRRRHR